MLRCDRGRAGAVVQVQSAEEMTPRHGSDAQERRDTWSGARNPGRGDVNYAESSDLRCPIL